MADHLVWLSLGSNLEPENNLIRAVDLIAGKVRLLAVSSVWQSPPADGSAQPDYLNAAVLARTALSPAEIHSLVIDPVERALGRMRTADKNAPRTIDIDLAMVDDLAGEFAGSPLPHPDILRQAHAALPLAELSPEKILPGSGETLRAIAARFPKANIRRRGDLKLAPGGQPPAGGGSSSPSDR